MTVQEDKDQGPAAHYSTLTTQNDRVLVITTQH
jgi:hypothetical protein